MLPFLFCDSQITKLLGNSLRSLLDAYTFVPMPSAGSLKLLSVVYASIDGSAG